MAVSVYTSLSYICETRPRGEKNQGVEFEPIEAGYHPVLFICVHRSQWHVSNKLSEINFQFNIAPSRLWRSAFWEGPDQSSLPPNNRNLGWPLAKTGARYERGGLIVERFAIHSVRASFEPRASLIVRASKQLRASQSLRAPVVLSGWVRVPFGAFLSFYGVIKTAIGRPNQKSAEKCNTCLLVGVQINKKT